MTIALDLVAGSIAGAAQVIVGQPLDTVKTRAQVAPKGMFKGNTDILMQTIRKEGFWALYKGMASPLLGVAGVNSLLFASYAAAKRLVSPFPQLTLSETAVAGGMAGAANAILASPVEMFKVRMQGQYGGVDDKRLRAVFADVAKSGFRKGIMRGYWVTVAREIPAYAGFYTGFEYTKRKFQAQYGGPTQSIPVWALIASGSVGGISYWLSCYPLDVIKSRVQLANTAPKGIDYIAAEFRTIVRSEGFRGLFKGLTPSLLRSIPAAGATFAAFELSREFLESHTSI